MNTSESLNDRALKILREKLGWEEKDLELTASLSEDLGMNDLEKEDLISTLETELNFTVDDKSDLSAIKTVEDILHLVEEYANEF